MATLPRSNGHQLNKTEYKDYVHFLGNYKGGKKDQDQISIHTTDSGISVRSFPLSNSSNNTSSSSLNSDNSEISKNFCSSYTNYLEGYKNKKFQPVKPNFDENNIAINYNNNSNNKTIKTEIFIEVEQPKNYVTEVSKKFENSSNSATKTSNNKNGIVNNKINIFENNDKIAHNTLRKNQINKIEEVKSVKMSEKPLIKNKPEQFGPKLNFCGNSEPNSLSPPVTTVTQQKFIANNPKQTIPSPPVLPPQNFVAISKQTVLQSPPVVSQQNFIAISKQTVSPPPPVLPQQNFTVISKQTVPPPPPVLSQQNFNTVISKQTMTPPPPVLPPQNFAVISKQTMPPPPPVLPQQNFAVIPKQTVPSQPLVLPQQNLIVTAKQDNIPPPPIAPQNFVANSELNIPPPPAMPQQITGNNKTVSTPSPPPPPPPMMPNNFKPPIKVQVTNNNKPQIKTTAVRRNYSSSTIPSNGFNSARMNTETVVPVMNGNQKLDKNNPLVRKLVYGTLRGMYAAHHEKANDFLATLPAHMVKKENGIQNIINTIASNGDLEKLNGRVNPKVEQE